MKILLAIAIGIIIMAVIFQIYITMASGKSEIQSYEVIRTQEPYEIRYYPPAIMAKITSKSKSYRDLGYSGFGKLANYIFGGNSANKQIAMTSPVHMDDVIVPTAGSCGVAQDRMDKKEDGVTCYDWFFCTKPLSLFKVNHPKI